MQQGPDIRAQGAKYGIHVKRSKTRGRCLVSEKGIPRNTEILLYPGLVTPNTAHQGAKNCAEEARSRD